MKIQKLTVFSGLLFTLLITSVLQAQSRDSFLPDDFVVPERLETDSFILRPLMPKDAVKDYEAFITSVDHIRGGEYHQANGLYWPSQQSTVERNRKDLEWHYKRHLAKEDFAFTVLTPDESVCLGCVYILPAKSNEYDATVKMWVRKSEYDKGFDAVLYETVKKWVADEWPFKTPGYPGREVPWPKWIAMENDYSIREIGSQWDEAFNRGDAERLANLYSTKVVSMPPNRETILGRRSFVEDMDAFFEAYDAVSHTTIDSVEFSGNTAIERGRYSLEAKMKDDSGGISEQGKYLKVYKKSKRQWPIDTEIWNLDS
ncbi:YybH family protein [Pelagicoccus mobilis]|uniref:Nuclear transport factor 2 family protein n=1 Tax=Pelagicoccus mobilis TaxID=415221 RepID=A0A934S1W1_9BACT|nr:nuclear transport factor 2 family protein [Pelagicoccus mobilis]MBK1877563.1 nuclear transport factor 2 family protein [Pelagicoccus mobilis]